MAYQPKSYRKFIAGAVAAAVVAPVVAAPAALAAAAFDDIAGTRYEAPVTALAEKGIVKGDNGSFKPYSDITRGEAAIIVARALDLLDGQNIPANPFTDVGENTAAYEAITKLANEGIINGFDADTFGPYEKITRGQMAKIITGALSLELGDGVTSFSDVSSTATFAKHVDAIVEAGIANGKEDGTFGYSENILRGDFAVMIKNALDQDAPVDPAVENVSVINANEIKVVFNTKVLESSVEDASYTLDAQAPSAQDNITPADVQLQEDGKTAILRFADGDLVKSTTYKVKVENVLSTDYLKLEKYEGNLLFAGDNTAAALETAKVEGTDLLLTFNEEVDFANAVLRVDGVQVPLTGVQESNSGEAGDYTYTVDASNSAALDKGTHNLTVVGLKDVAGNESGTLTKSYSVSDDVTAPTVQKIEAVDADTFKVTFSEAVEAPTLKVLKGSTEFATAVKATDSEKVWEVTVDTTAGENDLFAEDETSVNLNVTVSNYKDAVSLYGETYTGSVSLKKDTTAPALLNSSLNTVEAGSGTTIITVPFNKADVEVLDYTKVRVINPDGIQLTPAEAGVVATSGQPTDKSTEVAVTVAGAPKVGTYTVVFEADALVDAFGNENAKITTTAKYTADETFAEPTNVIAEDNIITIDFGQKMTSSATNVANYKLDNAALPAGTTVAFTDTGKTKVELRLPATFKVVSDADYKFEITQNVKTDAGKTIVADEDAAAADADDKANYTKNIGLTDNVAPEFVSAKYVIDSTTDSTSTVIELTFNEDIALVDLNNLADDLELKLGTNKIDLAGTVGSVDGEKLYISVPELNVNQASTITIVEKGTKNPDVAIIDASNGDNAVVPSSKTVSGTVVIAPVVVAE